MCAVVRGGGGGAWHGGPGEGGAGGLWGGASVRDRAGGRGPWKDSAAPKKNGGAKWNVAIGWAETGDGVGGVVPDLLLGAPPLSLSNCSGFDNSSALRNIFTTLRTLGHKK